MSLVNLPLIFYVLKASIRDKLVISLLLVFLVSISLSVFIGSSAIVEANAASLTFISASARLIGVISLILFVVFYIRRAYETHDIEYLLSRPINRISFVSSHLLGLAILAIIFTALVSLGIYAYGHAFINLQGLIYWSMSILLELMIVSFAALFFAMVLPSAVTATMATLAGYSLARMSGQVLNIIDTGTQGSSYEILEKIMEAASVIVPRFDLFSQSAWLIYGPDSSISLTFIVLHGTIFCLLITFAAIFDLLRKEF